MQPERWNILFDKTAKIPIRAIKRRVIKEVHGHLLTLAPGIPISTNELVEALYPRATADKSLAGDKARSELYKMIGQLARDELNDCCVKGESNGQFMGRPKRPWLWFCPDEVKTCPHCGQLLPAEIE